MATSTAPTALPKSPRPHRFTVAEFDAILETPPFVERPQGTRFELIDGRIFEGPPVNDPHWLATQALHDIFARLGRRELVNQPVIISDFDEPLPDLAVVRADFPFRTRARGQDLLLVIEVSDSSRDYDLRTKLPRYQAGGVAEVWIVDLVEQVLHVWDSSQPASMARYPRGQAQQVTPARVDCLVDVDALFAAAYADTTPDSA
jgi:Uma2 family endonuclease